jgi:hypothetical protein
MRRMRVWCPAAGNSALKESTSCDGIPCTSKSFVIFHESQRSSHFALDQLLSMRANHIVQDSADLAAPIETN